MKLNLQAALYATTMIGAPLIIVFGLVFILYKFGISLFLPILVFLTLGPLWALLFSYFKQNKGDV